MNEFLTAVRAAGARIIKERRYVAPPDDVDDITITEDSRAWPELVAVDATLAASPEARRAVGLGADEPVPAGYGVAFMFRWLSEYRDAGAAFITSTTTSSLLSQSGCANSPRRSRSWQSS